MTVVQARFIRSAYLGELNEAIERNLERYRTATNFDELLNDPALTFSVDIDVDPSGFANLVAGEQSSASDVDNCIIIFRSIKKLSLYDARDERFWSYLCHTHGLEYARRRWPIPTDDSKAIAHIRTHFFARSDRQIERDNAISRLWWMAELCSRVEDMELREALNILLFRTDARAQIIERPTLSQNSQIFSEILLALEPYLTEGDGLFERGANRRFVQGLNVIGGYKLLDVLLKDELANTVSDMVRQALGAEF